MPLTADRAKPAVPFGGAYRLVDFVLSNLVNAGLPRDLRADPVQVALPRPAHHHDLADVDRCSATTSPRCPAQQRLGPRWYTGSADAIFQSLNLVYDETPDYVVVFGADHVYRMDPSQMVDAAHRQRAPGSRSPASGCRGRRRPSSASSRPPRRRRRSRAFLEKPADPPAMPGRPGRACYASMGNYVFTTDVLIEALKASTPATRARCTTWAATSSRCSTEQGAAQVYDFAENDVPGATDRDRGYWRDVGTLDAYHDAHMDLVSVHPIFNLYNRQWPILTHLPPLPPAEVRRGRQRARVDGRAPARSSPAATCAPVGDLQRRRGRRTAPTSRAR